MFTTGIKGAERCNGVVSFPSNNRRTKTKFLSNYLKQKALLAYQDDLSIVNRNSIHNSSPYECIANDVDLNTAVNGFSTTFKSEPVDEFDTNTTAHSIIGLSDDSKAFSVSPVNKRNSLRDNEKYDQHETLERIENLDDDDDDDDLRSYYQQYWFSSSLERLKLEDRSREERIELTRYELKKQLKQMIRSGVGRRKQHHKHQRNVATTGSAYPEVRLQQTKSNRRSTSQDRLVPPRTCEAEECGQPALPCTRYCTLHIMRNTEQILFDYCTAKFADNTQCSVPVFDITHELPLCPEHARKRDNYKLYQEAKPKKLRKKVKPSAMIRPQKRSKKKKRTVSKQSELQSSIVEPIENSVAVCGDESDELSEDMVQQVLAMQEEPDGLELVSVEEALVTQASNLLEGADINTVLSTIQADEFNDLFTVNRNGDYEPSKEEAEELERALAAVDNDVKSLEKLSQSQGLLDSLLDEHTLVESLVQIPDMFHNGYVPCGDSMVAQTSTRLLPVEPHSHS